MYNVVINTSAIASRAPLDADSDALLRFSIASLLSLKSDLDDTRSHLYHSTGRENPARGSRPLKGVLKPPESISLRDFLFIKSWVLKVPQTHPTP